MTDFQFLALILIGLYLAECAMWVSQASVGFTAWFDASHRPIHVQSHWGNNRGGFLFAPPFPPLGGIFLAHPLPLSASPDFVFSYVATTTNPSGRAAQQEICIPLRDIRTIEVSDSDVLLNEKVFLKTQSAPLARAVAKFLVQLRDAPHGKRESLITAQLAGMFDTEKISERLDAFQLHTGALQVFCNILFVALMVVLPLALAAGYFLSYWLPLCVSALLALVIVLVEFFRAHKKLYPKNSGDRVLNLLHMIFLPPAAIRARSFLARELLSTFHPLAVARVLCPPAMFRDLAERIWRDAQQPLIPVCDSNVPEGRAVEEWARAQLNEQVRRFICQEKLDPQEFLKPPTREDVQLRSFCPRCHCQYLLASGVCRDCGGVPLRAFNT